MTAYVGGATPWIRNRIAPDVREAIRAAGVQRVWFGQSFLGRGWVTCDVTDADGEQRTGAGPNPLAAFERTMAAPVQLVTLLDGAS